MCRENFSEFYISFTRASMWDDANQVILIRMDHIVASHKGVTKNKAIDRTFDESNIALVY